MSEARNVYPRLCWGCLGVIENFQHDHGLLDYGGYCTDCHKNQVGELQGLRQALQGYTELMNTVSARNDIINQCQLWVQANAPTCKVLIDGNACGEPALFRAGVPTASGDFTIPVCEGHCPGIITSIVESK